jgi:hypothetical protein
METKYAENQRKASKAYYHRQRQKKLDKKTASLLKELYAMSKEELLEKWPETKKVLR